MLTSPFLTKLWGNFGGMQIQIEIPILSDPIVCEEWAVHYRQFLPPLIVPIRANIICTWPPYAPTDWVNPWVEVDPPASEELPTEPVKEDVALELPPLRSPSHNFEP